MKVTLVILAVFVVGALSWTPPSPPVIGDDWSFMGITDVYDKRNGTNWMWSGWYYGDSAQQTTAVILVGEDFHVGILEDAVKDEVFIADYNNLQCYSKSEPVVFVGKNFFKDYKFTGTSKRPEAPMCGEVDEFEMIKNDTVFQTYFIHDTNIPCYTKTETNDAMELFWYADFKYNNNFGPGFMEKCPFPSHLKKTEQKKSTKFQRSLFLSKQ